MRTAGRDLEQIQFLRATPRSKLPSDIWERGRI
jgi:hypothetical protein